jgi:hypothetical protein
MPLDLNTSRIKAFASGTRWLCDFGTKEVFHRKSAEDFSKERKSPGLIARVTQQVFPLRQPAIPLSQQELPLQRDSSLQSPQAGSWELDLSQG